MLREPVGDKHLHSCWGYLILAVITWHGITIVRSLGTDYLFSMCFLSNIILAAGIIIRSGLMIGVGFGWALIALPLWAVTSWLAGRLMVSSLAFHAVGVCTGFIAVKHVVLPHWLALVAIPAGLFSCLLARMYTSPENNINAAFRVQDGWIFISPDIRILFLIQIVAYSLVFMLVPVVSNRWIYSKAGDQV